MATDTNIIISWFKTGKKPTQSEYSEAWQSFWNKLEQIPQDKVDGLISSLLSKSDVTQKITKIDTLLVNNVYIIKEEDFGSVLRYSGTADITVLLSTNIPYQTGKCLSLLQSGSGGLTFAANGFILNYSADESPKIFGAHCMAGILITDSQPPSVLIYGKLKLNK